MTAQTTATAAETIHPTLNSKQRQPSSPKPPSLSQPHSKHRSHGHSVTPTDMDHHHTSSLSATSSTVTGQQQVECLFSACAITSAGWTHGGGCECARLDSSLYHAVGEGGCMLGHAAACMSGSRVVCGSRKWKKRKIKGRKKWRTNETKRINERERKKERSPAPRAQCCHAYAAHSPQCHTQSHDRPRPFARPHAWAPSFRTSSAPPRRARAPGGRPRRACAVPVNVVTTQMVVAAGWRGDRPLHDGLEKLINGGAVCALRWWGY
ncbi:hypothetical protein BJ912DRAFT_1126351 [Pholiota molesta]|nr:hypothetical protein BJ912DRAFT_1126351 [Pholiota molesta]